MNEQREFIAEEKLKELKEKLTKEDLQEFFDILSVAGMYEAIQHGIPNVVEGSKEVIRDIEIAQLLQEKFPNMPYDSPEGFKNWLTERVAASSQSKANALSRLQGDGAGEVDFVQEMQGGIRRLFTKVDYARDASGNITSNIPGIDAVEVNRFTGKIINEYQIKTLRSEESIKSVLKSFQENPHYNENITLVGPKELIEEAKRQGLPNELISHGNVGDNLQSAEVLKDKILDGKMTTELTTKTVVGKVATGAVIGTAVSASVSSLFNYLDYKNGRISKKEMYKNIGKNSLKGAITGGALGGMSLVVPGGLIGLGLGIYVGKTLSNVLDEVYGDGLYAEILQASDYVFVLAKNLEDGIEVISQDERKISHHNVKIRKKAKKIEQNFVEFDSIMRGD